MIYVNNTPMFPTLFPDGTSQVWKLPPHILSQKTHFIRWDWDVDSKGESEAEFMHLAQLRDLLYGEIILFLPYLPYARQDKKISNDACFALTVFARLLNALHFDKVQIFDPHSSEALRLIWNSEAIYPDLSVIVGQFPANRYDYMVYPDKGAWEKYAPKFCNLGPVSLCADKVRDQATGKITSYTLSTPFGYPPPGSRFLVVDDICDGGATFVALAGLLKVFGPAQIDLYVSHGIFSRGTGLLDRAGITHIYTKDDL